MMKTIIAFAILALQATTWSVSSPARGTQVDCSKYFTEGFPAACPRMRRLLCGSDQKVYNNECAFCMMQQESGIQLTKLHDGECVKCTRYFACPKIYTPHCGSDGKVYGNKCLFCNAVVKSSGTLYLAKYGLC